MGKIMGIIALGSCILLSHPATGQISWYVAPPPSGSDSNPGTEQEPFATIQKGIDSASDGDTVIVLPGTYIENIQFSGKNIILTSTDPLDPAVVSSSIIDGNRAASVVTFSGDEDETCVLSGLTIQNGEASHGGGICGGKYDRRTHATIRNNTICNNACSDGGGLAFCDGMIQSNTISRNSASSEGGGLAQCHGTIQNNVITENLAWLHGGGLADCDGTIQNNTISGNRLTDTSGEGGGLYSCRGTVTDCIIWGNVAPSDPELFVSSIPSYSCIRKWEPGGMGNIFASPHFVDPLHGDYHLQSWSPCIDAGDPASPFPDEPEPNGGRVNMGAYGNTTEAAPKSADTDFDQLPDDWELQFFVDLAQKADDDPDNDLKPNVEEYELGLNPIIAVGTDAHWYVDASRPTSGSGLSWQTAFMTINEGMNAAYHREAVAVKQGTYFETVQFRGYNIILTSTNPLDPTVVSSTIIDGSSPYSRFRPVVRLSGTEDETCVLSGFTIRNGSCETGGGISPRSGRRSRATIRNNVIMGNTAPGTTSSGGEGGGIADCDGVIENNTIVGNSAVYGGGLHSCHGTIHNNVISENSALEGGGLYRCNGIIQNNVISRNTASITTEGIIPRGTGGGLHNCSGVIQNNVIYANLAETDGGGLFLCTGTIQNNTIYGNSAEGKGGGVADCSGTIRDCIIWGNLAHFDSQLVGGSDPTYCCIQYWTPPGRGEGNLTSAPHFVNPDNGDFHLRSWSPCIDAGDPASAFLNELAPNGFRVNMGAYGNTPEAASKSPDIDADGLPDDWEMHWLAGTQYDGSDDPDADGISNVREYYYAWDPGTGGQTIIENLTKATRYQAIQPALSESDDGDEIVVYPGVYVENINFGSKNVALRSAYPSDASVVMKTIVDGGGKGPAVTFSGSEDDSCVLSGFTIRNGKAHYGGGIYGGTSDHHTQATIENNIIIENLATAWTVAGGAGGGLAYCGGKIHNNTIARNRSDNVGGGLAFCLGTIQNNVIARNSAEHGGGGLWTCDGTIQNNTIYGNTSGMEGGGLQRCEGKILNCIIWDNMAKSNAQVFEGVNPTYSCIQKWTGGGKGNLTLNPHFVDPENGEFHLHPWSPCIDAGDPASSYSNEPPPNGGRVNMGAYGNTPEAASRSSDTDSDGLPDDWELQCFGDLHYTAESDPDGDGIPNGRELRYGWNPSSAAQTVAENLAKAALYQTIQATILESDDGDEIVVHPGIFQENIHMLGRNIIVRSTDPSDPHIVASTVIDGGGRGPVFTFTGTEDATCILSGFTIRSGTYGIVGGAWGEYCHATIQKHTIIGNSERGLLVCDGIIQDNLISGNSGGGLSSCRGTIQNNTISNNSDPYGGGGLWGCSGTIQNNLITGNSARDGGGLASCSGIVQNNTITGNSATGEDAEWCAGGGLHMCHGIIRNNTISENSADDYAGGLYACNGTIQNNIISRNSGSGLEGCEGTILGNTISGNSASYGGGLLSCDGTIQNNIIAGNSAEEDGGGLYYCNGTIQNNTITANSAKSGGGLHQCEAPIVNCIIWANEAMEGPQLYGCSAPRYSCIQDWTEGGEGNMAEDPRFLDAENGDFRLLASSPCIDAGDNSAADLPETDIAGMHRITYGGKSLTVDMGAYEYYINEIEIGKTGIVILSWSSLSGKRYAIYFSSDMMTWVVAAANVLSMGDAVTAWIDPTAPLLSPEVRTRYYRIKENQ